jgi:integrase
MATPKKSSTGNWTLFVAHLYQRCQITLGKIGKTEAYQFAANVDMLASHRKHSATSIPPNLESWVNSLTPNHREQFSKLGLLSSYNPNMTVQELIDLFLEDYEIRKLRKEIRASSVTQFESSMKRFPDYFLAKTIKELEPKRQSERINSAPVFSTEVKQAFVKLESWQREHYSPASWTRANGRLREVGNWAVKQGIFDYSPFSILPHSKSIDKSRNFEVNRETVVDAMAQCQHPDIRLLFALARFCGLRMLSEARTIKPCDVNWDERTLQILDSKKQAYRTMPLFKTVAAELERHQLETGGWTRYVLTDHVLNSSDQNATRFMKQALQRAGHTP